MNELISMPLIRIILRLKVGVNRFGRKIGSKRHFFSSFYPVFARSRAHLTLRLWNIELDCVCRSVFFRFFFFIRLYYLQFDKAVSLLSFRILCQIFYYYLFIEMKNVNDEAAHHTPNTPHLLCVRACVQLCTRAYNIFLFIFIWLVTVLRCYTTLCVLCCFSLFRLPCFKGS